MGVPREDRVPWPGQKEALAEAARSGVRRAASSGLNSLSPNTNADFSIVAGDLAAGVQKRLACRNRSSTQSALLRYWPNWKFVHDAFLENYHIPRLHSKSLGYNVRRRRYDLRRSVRTCCSLPRARATASRAPACKLRGLPSVRLIFSYPRRRSIVITSPTYINVMFLSPQSADKTVINYYMLVDRMPETEKEKARCEKSIN